MEFFVGEVLVENLGEYFDLGLAEDKVVVEDTIGGDCILGVEQIVAVEAADMVVAERIEQDEGSERAILEVNSGFGVQ